MSTSLTLIPEAELHAIARLDDIVTQSQAALIEAEAKPMLKGILMARAMNLVRESLSGPMFEDIKKLAGQPFGFKTDKDKDREKYPDHVIRDVAAVALLDGARIVGNEFNILVGQYYRTKEQLERRVREWPGLTNLSVELGLPVMSQSGKYAHVSAWATWKLNGKPCELRCERTDENRDTRIPVRVNEGMGADAIFGKAKRKLFHRIWELLRGVPIDDFEGLVDDGTIDATAVVVETAAAEPEALKAGTNAAPGETNAARRESNSLRGETNSPPSKTTPVDDFVATVKAAPDISSVRKAYESAFGPASKIPWGPDDHAQAIAACEARENEIRSTRGGRKAAK